MSVSSVSRSPAIELHYNVQQVAALWGLSDDTVRELFRDELGVLRIGNEQSTSKRRRKVTMVIPQSVLERVHRKLDGSG